MNKSNYSVLSSMAGKMLSLSDGRKQTKAVTCRHITLIRTTIKETTPPSKTEWTIWRDDDFQISYPPNWYAKRLTEPNSLVGFFSLTDSRENFNEVVTINKTTVVRKAPAGELGQQMEQFIKTQLPAVTIVCSRLIKLGSLEAAELTFNGALGDQSKSRMIIFSTDHAIYSIDIIYGLASATKYEKLFNQIIKTIQLF